MDTNYGEFDGNQMTEKICHMMTESVRRKKPLMIVTDGLGHCSADEIDVLTLAKILDLVLEFKKRNN